MSIEDFDQKAFIAEVRAFMKAHNLTTRQFAKISKVPAATLYRVEQDKNEIMLKTIRKLEKVMREYIPN